MRFISTRSRCFQFVKLEITFYSKRVFFFQLVSWSLKYCGYMKDANKHEWTYTTHHQILTDLRNDIKRYDSRAHGAILKLLKKLSWAIEAFVIKLCERCRWHSIFCQNIFAPTTRQFFIIHKYIRGELLVNYISSFTIYLAHVSAFKRVEWKLNTRTHWASRTA